MLEQLRKACDYLVIKAHPVYDKKTCGYCAMMIRSACDYGFGKHIKKFPSAKDAAPAYEEIGFKKIFSYPGDKKEDYKPELGDISIIQYEPHGHICMFTPKGWISDFIQRDMYGGKIREKNPPFAIYRYSTSEIEKI